MPSPKNHAASAEVTAAAASRVLEHFDLDIEASEELIFETLKLAAEDDDAVMGEAPVAHDGAEEAGMLVPEAHAFETTVPEAPVPLPEAPAPGTAAAEQPSEDEQVKASEAGEDDSDFEFEPAEQQGEGASGVNGGDASPESRARSSSDAQLLMRVAACSSASDVRQWTAHAPDEELLAMVRALRDLQASWLHADASLINLNVELKLLKQGQLVAELRGHSEKRCSVEESKAMSEQVTHTYIHTHIHTYIHTH